MPFLRFAVLSGLLLPLFSGETELLPAEWQFMQLTAADGWLPMPVPPAARVRQVWAAAPQGGRIACIEIDNRDTSMPLIGIAPLSPPLVGPCCIEVFVRVFGDELEVAASESQGWLRCYQHMELPALQSSEGPRLDYELTCFDAESQWRVHERGGVGHISASQPIFVQPGVCLQLFQPRLLVGAAAQAARSE